MARLKSKILLPLIILVLAGFSAYCEEIPVRIKASDLKFDHEARIITAHGSVEIIFEDVTIYSDSARVDLDSNLATAEGRVAVKQKDYKITSSSITYDISNESSVIVNLRTVFYPKEINANLYVGADTLRDTLDVKMGEYGYVTTCDQEDPHYHTEARWFDYYPDDMLVGYWVTLYVGPVPTVFTPYIIYNVQKRRAPFTFSYGENEVEGKFLKTQFDYFINNSANGLFYFDTTEKKGPGYGLLHDYKLSKENFGSLYYYTMDERDTKIHDYVFKLNHTYQPTQSSKLSLLHDSYYMYLIQGGRRFDNSSSVNYSSDNGSQKFGFNYNVANNNLTFQNSEAFGINNRSGSYYTWFNWSKSERISGQKTRSASDTFHHEQSLFTDDLKFYSHIAYTSYVTDEGFMADEKMEPKFDLTYKGPFYSASLTESYYVDVDGNNFRGDDTYSYLEKLPELNVAFNPVNLQLFTLSTNLGFARYHEAKYLSTYSFMRHLTTNRYSASAKLSRSDNLGFGTSLNTGLELEQNSYDTGDQRYRFVESARLDTGLWGFFRNSATWGRARVDGNTPFIFESLGSQHNYIKDTISFYYLSNFTWNFSGGYNYMNSRYDDVQTNMSIRPNDQLMINSSTGWSIENQRYLDWVTGATFVPWPKFSNSGSMTYDINVGKLLSANSEVDLEYGDTWQERFHFKMRHYYDFYTDTYVLQDIAVTKDLHCWEGYISWSQYMQEFRFGMTLKAFPSYPFSYVNSPAGDYFNSFMNNMHFDQASPRRD